MPPGRAAICRVRVCPLQSHGILTRKRTSGSQNKSCPRHFREAAPSADQCPTLLYINSRLFLHIELMYANLFLPGSQPSSIFYFLFILSLPFFNTFMHFYFPSIIYDPASSRQFPKNSHLLEFPHAEAPFKAFIHHISTFLLFLPSNAATCEQPHFHPRPHTPPQNP